MKFAAANSVGSQKAIDSSITGNPIDVVFCPTATLNFQGRQTENVLAAAVYIAWVTEKPAQRLKVSLNNFLKLKSSGKAAAARRLHELVAVICRLAKVCTDIFIIKPSKFSSFSLSSWFETSAWNMQEIPWVTVAKEDLATAVHNLADVVAYQQTLLRGAIVRSVCRDHLCNIVRLQSSLYISRALSKSGTHNFVFSTCSVDDESPKESSGSDTVVSEVELGNGSVTQKSSCTDTDSSHSVNKMEVVDTTCERHGDDGINCHLEPPTNQQRNTSTLLAHTASLDASVGCSDETKVPEKCVGSRCEGDPKVESDEEHIGYVAVKRRKISGEDVAGSATTRSGQLSVAFGPQSNWDHDEQCDGKRSGDCREKLAKETTAKTPANESDSLSGQVRSFGGVSSHGIVAECEPISDQCVQDSHGGQSLAASSCDENTSPHAGHKKKCYLNNKQIWRKHAVEKGNFLPMSFVVARQSEERYERKSGETVSIRREADISDEQIDREITKYIRTDEEIQLLEQISRKSY